MFRMAIIEGLLFILSTGVFYIEYRKNSLAVFVAGLFAVASSISLLVSSIDFFKSPTAILATSAPIASIHGPAADEIFWLSIRDTSVAAFYDEFLRKFPSSTHATEARMRVEELKKIPADVVATPVPYVAAPGPSTDEVFWLSIKDSEVIALFDEYVKKYPAGEHVAEARIRVVELKQRLSSWSNEPKKRTPQGTVEYFSNP